MSTITNASIPLKLFGAVLALTLIAAAVVAIALTAGPTQAQNADNTYSNPQPCGSGPESLASAFMEEPHERTTGHYALFDTYWEKTEPDPAETPGLGDEPANTGILHTNTCPPYVSQSTEPNPDGGEGQKITVTTYAASGVDIDELIIHVTDLRKVAVVATDAEATAGQLSLERYKGLREALRLGNDDAVPAGTEVWWLRTDDPSTAVDESAVDDPDTTEDETTAAHSNGLSLGFSTRHLDSQYWARKDDAAPLHYAFEVERNPGIPAQDHPHVLNYQLARNSSATKPKEIWNSVRVHAKPLEMEPGQYESLEWIFTKAGTYEIAAHLIGWVNHTQPTGAGKDWKPISSNETETSEVKRYVIQVGDELLENEPPVFGLNFTLTENTPPGTLLGGPIAVNEADAETLYYSLSGDGHEDFELVPSADTRSVQIKVAAGASIDYERQDEYKLRLNVTDRIDHESNRDLSIDDYLSVVINVEDIPTSVVIKVDNHNPSIWGGPITFTAVVTDFGEPHPGRVIYHFSDESGSLRATNENSLTIGRGIGGPQTMQLYVTYLPPGGDPDTDTQRIDADPLTIVWTAG